MQWFEYRKQMSPGRRSAILQVKSSDTAGNRIIQISEKCQFVIKQIWLSPYVIALCIPV